MRFFIGLPLLAICVSGCVTTTATLLDPTVQYDPVDPNEVRIFLSEEELAEYEFVRVAIISSAGDATYTSRTGMIESMRKKAAEMGANAILMPSIYEPGAEAEIAGLIHGTVVNRRAEVIGLRILGEKE